MISNLEYKLDFLGNILMVYTASMSENTSKGDNLSTWVWLQESQTYDTPLETTEEQEQFNHNSCQQIIMLLY